MNLKLQEGHCVLTTSKENIAIWGSNRVDSLSKMKAQIPKKDSLDRALCREGGEKVGVSVSGIFGLKSFAW